jgi:nicotinamidase-related amidase
MPRLVPFILAVVGVVIATTTLRAADDQPAAPAQSELAIRPKVAGQFQLELRRRVEDQPGSGAFRDDVRTENWNVAETAIIICDMWNNHYCQLAAQRVDEMAPRMNSVLTKARAHGALVIHAPSGTMDQYEDTPFRRRMIAAPNTEAPIKLEPWCYLDPKSEAPLPIDDKNSSCDDPVVGPAVKVFDRQHAAIKMIGYDGVSDNGQEIYNRFQQEGIKNVVIMGVHTNMCVLGRPFGIRQLTRLGFNVALARDLTDAMYDPREYPYVSHTRGTELVIEHVEQHWCPTLVGEDLTHVAQGTNNPDPDVKRPAEKPVAGK